MSTKTIQIVTNFSRLNIFSRNTSYFRHYSRTINKEQARQSLAVTTPAPDYLIQNLKNAKTSQNVLEIVGAHYNIMNTKQLMQALRSIFTVQKHGSSMSTNQIISNNNFEKLCHQLKQQAGLIDLNETIEALKVVSYIGVSSKSTIVQVLLQLIRHNINDLSLHHLIFLDFLLKQFQSTPLVDALLIALPIVFDVNLPLKMDKSNVTYLVEYLQYVSRKKVSEHCISLIVNNLYAHLHNNDLVEPKLAKSIVWSICDMEENEFFQPLLKEALNALLMNFDGMDWRRDIDSTLTKLALKYSSRYSFYYDDVFFDTCANYVVDKDLGFDEAIHTLRKLLKVNHSNENLLNYLSKVCHDNPNLLKQTSAMNMFNIVTSVAQTEFKPVHWKTIEDELIHTDCFKYHNSDILWMKLNKALCSLDIYKFDVLEKCFNSSYLDFIMRQKHALDIENFVLSYQAISAFQPNYEYLLPPKTVLDNVVTQLKPIEYPLEVPLQNGLGGEKYVQTCVKTTVGHHIDHVIVLRKGGYPVALSNDIEYLENIEVPSDSNMILVFALGSSHYTANNKRLKGDSALMLRTLECKGRTVIPISLEIWKSLADFEKVPYLMQAIKVKTENEMVSNVV